MVSLYFINFGLIAFLATLSSAVPTLKSGLHVSNKFFSYSDIGESCTTSLSCGKNMICHGTFFHSVCIEVPDLDSRPCNVFGSKCSGNKVCAGTIWTRRCVIGMRVGERCGQDPFWVCESGLNCKNGICRDVSVNVGGSCLAEGSVCENGSVCAGTETTKRCVSPMSEGKRCGQDPFWVCESDLFCVSNICKKY